MLQKFWTTAVHWGNVREQLATEPVFFARKTGEIELEHDAGKGGKDWCGGQAPRRESRWGSGGTRQDQYFSARRRPASGKVANLAVTSVSAQPVSSRLFSRHPSTPCCCVLCLHKCVGHVLALV